MREIIKTSLGRKIVIEAEAAKEAIEKFKNNLIKEKFEAIKSVCPFKN